MNQRQPADEVQCRLQGGEYVLPMDEFRMTEILDYHEAGSGSISG